MFKRVGFALGVVALVSVAARAMTAPQQMPRDRTAAEQRASDLGAFERKVAEMEAQASARPSDASAQHLVGTFYHEKSRDQMLSRDQKLSIVKRGLAAEDRALALNADYVEALVYKNILLRVQATLDDDPALQQDLIRDADALRTRALTLQASRPAPAAPARPGAAPGPPPSPPPPPPAPPARRGGGLMP